jgi:predicted RNase H-like HicB family nuclease
MGVSISYAAVSRPDLKNARTEVQFAEYKIALRESEEGFSVSVPGLPGCWSQGGTEEEALENIQDAIREYLAAVDDLLEGQQVREVEVAV